MKPNLRSFLALCVLASVVFLTATGCATRKFVRKEILATEDRTGDRIEVMQSQIENAEIKLGEHDTEIAQQGDEMTEISATAQEALDRAIAAGKLAEGKFVMEKVLSGSDLRFGFDNSDLSDEAKTALDSFGAELSERNEKVYIEIQGHTDSIGSDDYNFRLGEARAEAVRRYLNSQLGFPLHRMSVISYGESAPAVENATRDNRALNRRVALVVLK